MLRKIRLPVVIAIAGLFLSAQAVGAQIQSQPLGETLTRIARTGKVKVGYIPTPGTFAFLNEKGETVGYSIDLCLRVIENIKRSISRPDLRTEFRPLEAAQRIPLLKSGEIDIECGGNTNTVARQQDVDFSYTFFNTGVRYLVLKPVTADRTANFWKKKIAVTKGTTAQDIVLRIAKEQNATAILVANDVDGVQKVESGEVAAFAQDDVLLYGLISAAKKKEELAVAGNFLTVEPYAFMLPKNDLPFREIVDKTLVGLMQSGELALIYKKWFDNDRLRIPMSVYMKENIRFPSRYGIP
ncbi:MAG TPA: amino acid ABC transporter substrate-binding protein [Methylibium sp.]|uniref:amino acid ABC transporter substrate-binding protein n=1 Tax=Methylibium sp. TaxID=2067992 RepID=UPI002DB6FAA6|nr:amino acid ABC transporter substrate-binding protein [Methylibium sp.]HEU4460085.1 amino acid ABC transporter substrate-binding protein [Methylibium sp.]